MDIKRIDHSLTAKENFAAGIYIILVAEALRLTIEHKAEFTATAEPPTPEEVRLCIAYLPEVSLQKLITGEPVVTTLRTYISATRKAPREAIRAASKVLNAQYTELDGATIQTLTMAAASRCRHIQLKETKRLRWKLLTPTTVGCSAVVSYAIA